MNNQKDTQKTDIHSYGHSNMSDYNTLNNKTSYDAINKKTEKLVTALYMVTDCMDTDDALKAKLRYLGVELLSDVYKISTLQPMEKNTHIAMSVARVGELLSCVSIASTIGFVSDMNSAILRREFKNLLRNLEPYQSKDSTFAFTLDEEMFDVETQSEDIKSVNDSIKDIQKYNGQITKKPYQVSSYGAKVQIAQSPVKGLLSSGVTPVDKQERTRKILALIKDRSLNQGGSGGFQSGLSIKDISVAFTDCSEKTIQRELNSLVSKGEIQKTGAKRWSRYLVA